MADMPNAVWGFRADADAWRPKSIEQGFALIAGISYIIGGLLGFVLVGGFQGFAANGDATLFVILDINPFHNVVHLGVGAMWLLAALFLDRAGAEGVNFGIAGVYLLAAILGFLGYLEVLSIDSTFAGDNFLHLLTGAITLVFAGPLRVVRRESLNPA